MVGADGIWRIHTVTATSTDLGVAVFPRSMRRQLFDLVCAGVSVREAERRLGVSTAAGSYRWHQAGGMALLKGSKGPAVWPVRETAIAWVDVVIASATTNA